MNLELATLICDRLNRNNLSCLQGAVCIANRNPNSNVEEKPQSVSDKKMPPPTSTAAPTRNHGRSVSCGAIPKHPVNQMEMQVDENSIPAQQP